MEVIGADLCGRNISRNGEDRHARTMAIEQSIDEMQISGPATARAHREFAGHMRLGTGRKGGNLFVAHMQPLNLSLATNGVDQAVEAVTDDAIDSA